MVPGKSYVFMFPRHNFYGVVSQSELRRLRVESIRDMNKEPVDRLTEVIQPLLRRGRYLVTGLDLDKNEKRSFYVDSMREIVELDPEQSERQPITLWIVDNQPYPNFEAAQTAAMQLANDSGRPAHVEKLIIPVNLRRGLDTVIKPNNCRPPSRSTRHNTRS